MIFFSRMFREIKIYTISLLFCLSPHALVKCLDFVRVWETWLGPTLENLKSLWLNYKKQLNC